MDELFATVDAEPTFFCGGANNESAFIGDFEKRFALHTSSENLRSRLQSKERGEPGHWVDGSQSLQKALEWNSRFAEVSMASGAILIDSSIAPDVIADTILTHTKIK